MINPAAKLAAHEKELAKLRKKRRKRRRAGPVSATEKLIIAEVVKDAPLSTPNEKQIDALSITLRRSPEVIKSIVVAAREKFQANSLHYVDLHNDAVQQALAGQDFDVARKGAEWAIERISARDADGKIERIVDKVESESSAPRIQIGIQLGGLPSKSR